MLVESIVYKKKKKNLERLDNAFHKKSTDFLFLST